MYNPPSAPHHGRSWEGLVRSCKRVLYSILGPRKITEEVFQATYCPMAQSLNTRPPTPVSIDQKELEAHTPNHSLVGQHSVIFPSVATNDHFHHRNRYFRAQLYAIANSTRWLRE